MYTWSKEGPGQWAWSLCGKAAGAFYRNRETFAYSCEAYACVIERGKRPVERRALAQQYARTARISDERVDGAEIAGIVRATAEARNGWKLILTMRAKPALVDRHCASRGAVLGQH